MTYVSNTMKHNYPIFTRLTGFEQFTIHNHFDETFINKRKLYISMNWVCSK